MSTSTLHIVIDLESDPPELLGTLLPSRDGDEDTIRYIGTGTRETEKIAPYDCVSVVTVTVP